MDSDRNPYADVVGHRFGAFDLRHQPGRAAGFVAQAAAARVRGAATAARPAYATFKREISSMPVASGA